MVNQNGDVAICCHGFIIMLTRIFTTLYTYTILCILYKEILRIFMHRNHSNMIKHIYLLLLWCGAPEMNPYEPERMCSVQEKMRPYLCCLIKSPGDLEHPNPSVACFYRPSLSALTVVNSPCLFMAWLGQSLSADL